ncbi:hypothetical protein OKW28_008562 [Paraburkholderia sp. 40]
MRVRHLLYKLRDADPDAVVLYLAPYADESDADEIVHVNVPTDSWTCERHYPADGRVDQVFHPTHGGLSLGWDPETDEQSTVRVVILSSTPGAVDG